MRSYERLEKKWFETKRNSTCLERMCIGLFNLRRPLAALAPHPSPLPKEREPVSASNAGALWRSLWPACQVSEKPFPVRGRAGEGWTARYQLPDRRLGVATAPSTPPNPPSRVGELGENGATGHAEGDAFLAHAAALHTRGTDRSPPRRLPMRATKTRAPQPPLQSTRYQPFTAPVCGCGASRLRGADLGPQGLSFPVQGGRDRSATCRAKGCDTRRGRVNSAGNL